MIIQKPITPEWGDAAVRSWRTGLRIVFPGKTNDDHDPKLFESFRLIFTGVFHDIFIRTWPVYEFNKLLLSPPRLGRTLIVYFQLIMKICYRNWYWCLSRPSRVRWAAEKIVRKCSVPGVVRPRACWASAYNLFFCWDRVAFFERTRGREYSNSKPLKEKTSTRTQKGALSLN